MRVVVAGASSVLGASFARAASDAGHTVIALVRRRSCAVEAFADEVIVVEDVRNVEPRHMPEDVHVVVNFATGTDGSAVQMVDVATAGSVAILRAASRAGASRFIHVSSMSVYPGLPRPDPSRSDGRGLEPHPERRGAYAWSKTAAELALAAEPTDSLHVDIVRPGLVFGPRMANPLAGTAVRLPFRAAIGIGRADQGVPCVSIEEVNRRLIALVEDSDASRGTTAAHDIVSAVPTKADVLAAYRDLTGQARHVIWIPRAVAMGGARLVDAARRVQGTQSTLAYATRRLYDFEPADLQATDGEPHEGTLARAAVEASITLRRDGDGEPLRVRAEELLESAESAAAGPACVVLVGAGRIATEMHLPAIAALPHGRIIAVVDSDIGAANSIARDLGAVVAPDLEHLPAGLVDGNVVSIATPGLSHKDLVLQAVELGATVIVEKPMVVSGEQLDTIVDASSTTTIDAIHNYRLRPAALRLWRFLADHDVGPLRRASVTFHSPRIERERARWLRDEAHCRALLLELGVHFLDLAFLVAGPLEAIRDLDVEEDPRGGGLLRAGGCVETRTGGALTFDLDLSGVAQRTDLCLAFERATCVLDFFPDGFRVLPPRANPIDDAAAVAARLGSALWQRLRPTQAGIPKRALPHAAIYRTHLRSRESGLPSPFSVRSMEPQMRSILELADATYDHVATR